MIGVIGGMGVFAGTDLVDKINAATVAVSDQSYLPVALLSVPDIPDRSAFALGDRLGINPGEVVRPLVDKLVQIGCTVCGVACNTFHLDVIFDHIAGRQDVEVVNIVSETARQLGEHVREVGDVVVLGTRGTMQLGLYDRALKERGLTVRSLSDEGTESVSLAIRDVPRGLKHQALRPTDFALGNVLSAIDEAIALGASSVVLGCTELPFVLRSESALQELRQRDVMIVDPTTLLARALVRLQDSTKLAAGSWSVDLH